MALRDQPYLPLYVQDYLTDEKLSLCSWSSQGVYIKLLCLLHKSDPYGVILLKQNEKQNIDTALNFAKKISKLLPIESESLYNALTELIDEGCLIVEDDKLYQKRMVRDNLISIKRAESGKIGGNRTQKNAKAKIEANAENENINEDINDKINADFENFRLLYPGAKRGYKTEFENFQKKHKNWRLILPLLLPNLKRQIADRAILKNNGGFVPEWQHLQTYLNQSSWEITYEAIKKPEILAPRGPAYQQAAKDII